MIKAKVGNLLELIDAFKIDGILNAANGIGVMGAGIAGAIKRYGGEEIQKDAIRVCKKLNPKEGQSYSTVSGKLKLKGVKRIIHAITMKNPGGETSIEVCKKAFKSAIERAKKRGIKNLGCTALGTGIGRLDPKKVAEMMFFIANESDLNITFIDFDKDFINKILEERDNLRSF